MVRDHATENLYRDYAFVEYFSLEEASNALEQLRITPLFIRGDQIFASYSKIKRDDHEPMIAPPVK